MKLLSHTLSLPLSADSGCPETPNKALDFQRTLNKWPRWQSTFSGKRHFLLKFGWIMIFTKIALKSSWRGLHSSILPSLRVLRALRTAFCRSLPTSAKGHGSGTDYLISAYTGPAYINRSMHAYWQLPSQKRATKSCEVTCRELTPNWCKDGMCRNVFSTAINGRSTAENVLSTAENVLSTGCLRFVYGPFRSQATSNELNKSRLYDST